MGGFSRERELGVLVELCRELVRLGVKVGMSDARPAVTVRGGLVDRKIFVQPANRHSIRGRCNRQEEI